MTPLLRDVADTLRTAPGFTAALLLTLVVAALNGVLVGLMALRLEALLPGPFAQMGHFTQPHHRTHDLTFSFLFVPAVAGVLAQLRRPSRNVAGMLAVLVPFAALAVVLLLTATLAGNARVLQPPWVMVGAAALIATALHPTGRDFFRSFGRSRVSAVMAVLVAVAAVPLLVFATTNARLQGTAIDDHAAMGHYGFMAAFALTTIGVGLLASVRPDGWRVTAWVAGLLPVLLGLTSLGYPAATSSLSHLWALTAIVWGVIFVVAAEHPRVRRAASTTHTDPPASR